MTCNDDLNPTAQDFQDASVHTIWLGSKKRISINVYQPKSDIELEEGCGCADRNSLVIPPTITISDPTINIYLSPDEDTPVLTAVPAVTDIIDSDAVLVGWKVSYLIDTTASPMDVVGNYLAVIGYDVDTGESYLVPVLFRIIKPNFPSGC